MTVKYVVRETSNPGNVLAVRDTYESAFDEAEGIEDEFDYDVDVREIEEEDLPSDWREFYVAD